MYVLSTELQHVNGPITNSRCASLTNVGTIVIRDLQLYSGVRKRAGPYEKHAGG